MGWFFHPLAQDTAEHRLMSAGSVRGSLSHQLEAASQLLGSLKMAAVPSRGPAQEEEEESIADQDAGPAPESEQCQGLGTVSTELLPSLSPGIHRVTLRKNPGRLTQDPHERLPTLPR